MADIHTTIIIEDQDVGAARAIAAALSPAGYAEFRVGLRPKGETGPATHWLTSGWLGEQFIALTKDENALHAVCQQFKLPYTLKQITDMIARATVRPVEEISALALLDEMGLEVVAPEEP